MPIPPSKRSPRCAAGVSRLEVLWCLVLVSVLAALLLDRLAGLNEAARPVRLQQAMASARAAAGLFHARCEALRARGEAACTQLALDGEPVAGVHGWPAASADGIARAARLGAGFELRPAAHRGAAALFVALGGPHCQFVYVQATGPDVVPRVDIVDASCQ